MRCENRIFSRLLTEALPGPGYDDSNHLLAVEEDYGASGLFKKNNFLEIFSAWK